MMRSAPRRGRCSFSTRRRTREMGPTARARAAVFSIWRCCGGPWQTGAPRELDDRDRDRTGGQRGWTEKLIERARQRDGETRQQVIWIVRRPEKTRCDPWELPLVSTPSVAVPRPAAVSPPFLFFFVFWFFSFLFFFFSSLLLLLLFPFFLPSVLLYKSSPCTSRVACRGRRRPPIGRPPVPPATAAAATCATRGCRDMYYSDD